MKQEYALADFIFVPSENVFDSFVAGGIDEQKLFIIPYGVDTNRFRPHFSSNSDQFIILYVGSISLAKGVQYLLKAYAEFRRPDTKLLLIGQVDDSIKGIMAQYQEFYEFVGYVPNYELTKYYTSASVFVMPSLSEGSSLVTYEAMACGTPVITTYKAGSVVRDGKDGFLVPIRDVRALKERIIQLYEDRTLLEVMGESARERAEEFTWEQYEQRVVNTYEQITARKGIKV